jgi:hypothetical protein
MVVLVGNHQRVCSLGQIYLVIITWACDLNCSHIFQLYPDRIVEQRRVNRDRLTKFLSARPLTFPSSKILGSGNARENNERFVDEPFKECPVCD